MVAVVLCEGDREVDVHYGTEAWIEDDEAVIVEKVEQGEAAPLPFPSEVWA